MQGKTIESLKRTPQWAAARREMKRIADRRVDGIVEHYERRIWDCRAEENRLLSVVDQLRVDKHVMLYRCEHPWFNLYVRARTGIARAFGKKGE